MAQNKREDDEQRIEALKNEMKNLRNSLATFGFPKIGDLFSNSIRDIEATLRRLAFLLFSITKRNRENSRSRKCE